MDEIELIKEKINVVDLISEYLPLKKAGVNFKGSCPFHQEKTPSFMVSPERGIFHCFGCGVGGDIFKFLMEKEGIEFKEALEILAQKAGVTLKRSSAPDKAKDLNDRLYEANTKAMQFFNYLLTTHPLGKKALDYLHSRGIKDETIKEFQIGYALNSWETLTKFLKKRGFKTEELILSGLGVSSKRGCYDRFRGRVMFPLIDVRNRVIGFSGRVLGKEEPKYINTPQTPIFDKKRFLLGLNLTKGIIKEKDEAIIVEGEMDMIMSYQEGIKNIVASKGTALTEDQVITLKKYTENISLCFDTDLAGDAASRRGIEIADKAGCYLMADVSHITGLIVAGVHPSPVPYAHIITTTTHKTLRGPRGGMIMCKEKFAGAIDKAIFPGIQGGPHDHINAAKAVAFGEALKPSFKKYSEQTMKNAKALAAALQKRGYRIISGGTDNHLILVDIFGSKNITGKESEHTLEAVGISVNKNMIPFDPRKPMDPSGLRLGTPAVTTRGAKERDMEIIAGLLDEALQNKDDEKKLLKTAKKVKEFSLQFPVPGINA